MSYFWNRHEKPGPSVLLNWSVRSYRLLMYSNSCNQKWNPFWCYWFIFILYENPYFKTILFVALPQLFSTPLGSDLTCTLALIPFKVLLNLTTEWWAFYWVNNLPVEHLKIKNILYTSIIFSSCRSTHVVDSSIFLSDLRYSLNTYTHFRPYQSVVAEWHECVSFCKRSPSGGCIAWRLDRLPGKLGMGWDEEDRSALIGCQAWVISLD